MTHGPLYPISEEWHENLRKYSEIFGKFFSPTCRNNFVYSINISAIQNLSHSSQITLSHPCKPGYKHSIFSIVKLSFRVQVYFHLFPLSMTSGICDVIDRDTSRVYDRLLKKLFVSLKMPGDPSPRGKFYIF